MSSATEPRIQSADVITTSVRALFLHGPRASEPTDPAPTPMIAVARTMALTGLGLEGDDRYLSATRRNGSENLRQVSLIDEGTLARLIDRFGPFPLEFVKSQIVLAGDIRLSDCLGHRIRFGEGEDAVILELTIHRQPCYAMDLIHPGLKAAMENGEQGALARVLRGGLIEVGMPVTVRGI
ncbi:MAG TPA: MOSC domain-containing protein [Chloroflexota bacterium]|nr:MOSC domain-containing protein [Chloroflexota bacterium]